MSASRSARGDGEHRGPERAGKSTLSKLICGFETPDAGEIFLNGKSLAEENIRRRARHIGYVMQNPNQMISKTMIYDEVALGLQRSGLTEEQIRERWKRPSGSAACILSGTGQSRH